MAGDYTQVDYANLAASAKVAADGTATAAFEVVDTNDMWQVTRAVVACTSVATSKCLLHVCDANQSPSTATIRSGTNSGNFDEADYPGDGLTIFGDQQLLAVWSDADPGATVVCTITYRRYTQT